MSRPMTREERRDDFEVYADIAVRAHQHRRARGLVKEAHDDLVDMMRTAYQLGVKDGQAIALQAQHQREIDTSKPVNAYGKPA